MSKKSRFSWGVGKRGKGSGIEFDGPGYADGEAAVRRKAHGGGARDVPGHGLELRGDRRGGSAPAPSGHRLLFKDRMFDGILLKLKIVVDSHWVLRTFDEKCCSCV